MIHQPKLSNESDGQLKSNGPVFEFGPGWGAKTKKWFKKYIVASDCSLCRNTRYILLAGIVVLTISWPYFKKTADQQSQDKLTGQIKIAEVVRPGDSKIKLARRALSNYLTQFPDQNLTNGQRVFIETVLGQGLVNDTFKTGINIEFPADTIKSAIEKSKLLSPSQLKYWESAAKGIKF